MAQASDGSGGAKHRRLRLRLYVKGDSANSIQAIANARAMCAEHFASGHELEIVDMLEQPSRAIADRIIVTPTLMKLLPLPARRVIGNLSDAASLLLMLSGK